MDALDFSMQAIADVTPESLAGRNQGVCLFGCFSFDAPFLDAGHVDGRMEHLQFRLVFESRDSHFFYPLSESLGDSNCSQCHA
jgi:hypothetical protein